jgi:hypothetical protein
LPRGPGTFSLSTFPLSRIHIATTAPRRNLFGRALERGSRPSCRDLISRAETISANPAPAIERLRAAGPVIEVRFPIVGRVWITTTQGRRTHQRARNGGNGLLAAWRRLGDNNAPDQWQFTKPRFVRRDVDLDGVRLRKGEKIMAMLAAANMDPEANEHPDDSISKDSPTGISLSGRVSTFVLAISSPGSKANARFRRC